MKTITISYPDNATEEVVLADTPRVGESIRLRNGRVRETLVVEHVMWLEGTADDPQPEVVVMVRPHSEGPRG